MKQAFQDNVVYPVAIGEFLLDIAPGEPKFTLAAGVPADQVLELPLGGELTIPVKVAHGKDANGAISLALKSGPSAITLKSGKIEAGESAALVTLKEDKKVYFPTGQ